MFEPWELAMIAAAGYNGIRDEHIEEVAASLLSSGIMEIDQAIFEHHCYKCGINPDNFTDTDLEVLEELLMS